jgi:hypothetical protein
MEFEFRPTLRSVMRTTMCTFLTLTCIIFCIFLCYPHMKKETINENFQMSITIVSWHEHRSIYKVMHDRQRVIHCNRPMLYLTLLLILVSADIHSNPRPMLYLTTLLILVSADIHSNPRPMLYLTSLLILLSADIHSNPRPMLYLTSLLILVSADIHSNPGPVKFPCGVCEKPVGKNDRALECEACSYWVHQSSRMWSLLLLGTHKMWRDNTKRV